MMTSRPARLALACLATGAILAQTQVHVAAADVPSLEDVLRVDRPQASARPDPEAQPALTTPIPIQPAVDGVWSDEFGGLPGLNGTVWALVEFGGELVAGGDFTDADGVPAQHIAAWDGTAWHPLGAGTDGTVFALAVYAGDLVAGGSFYAAGGIPADNIARWNGTSWSPLTGGTDGSVRALLDHAGSLWVGGDFFTAGGVAADNIARWDGNAWHALGGGLTGGLYGFGVRALATYGTDVVAGGFFTQSGYVPLQHVARWDGLGWSPVGSWTDQQVYSLLEFAGELVAGSVVWFEGTGTWTNLIRSYDGSTWNAMGSGILAPPFSNAVRALASHAGELYAAGFFPLAGGAPVAHVARWNGSDWLPLGSGTSDNTLALAVHGGHLVAGGLFTVAGGEGALHVAGWDGSTWSPVSAIPPGGQGMDAPVWALVEWNGQVVAGGEFTTGGGTPVRHVAVWDGVSWSALGTGLPGTVYALAVYQGELVAGGSFSGGTGDFVARWDGSAWLPLGSGTDGPVRALAVGQDGLYVGGDFSWAGGGEALQVARWNGSAWSALGAGLHGGALGVRALVAFGDDVLAGGFFTHSGETPVSRVASWNGTEWKPFGTWTDDAVYSLGTYLGGPVAGSVVWTETSGTWLDMIARAEGDTWSPLGSGPLAPPFSNAVRALATYNGDLVASGFFPLAGGVAVNHVGRWDGTSWSPLGPGTNGNAVAVLAHGGRLFVGGLFTLAGGRSSHHIAAWVDDIPIPVTVEDLRAEATPDHVRLAWRLTSGLGELGGVSVERGAAAAGPFAVRPRGRLVPAPAMQFEDADVEPGESAWYRIVLHPRAGGDVLGAVLLVDVPGLGVTRTALAPMHDPADGGPVQVRFTVGGSGAVGVQLAVYDMQGRRVRQLPVGVRPPGAHALLWDRRDETGRRLARGVYVVRLATPAGGAARKLVLLHD